MESYIARIVEFEGHIDQKDGKVICLKGFKALCFGGIPDKAGLRQICWKVLLGYLPLDKSLWESTLMEKRRLYYSFVKDLVVETGMDEAGLAQDDESHPERKCDSEWSLFLQDNKTLEEIDKDVRRTLPDFAFFQLPIPYSPLCPLSIDPATRISNKKSTQMQERAATGSISTQQKATLDGFGSLVGSRGIQRRGTVQGSSIDVRRTSMSKAAGSTLKRRQTVTLMSPKVGKKQERSVGVDLWQQNSLNPPASVEDESETLPLAISNGFRTPNDHPSPVPSRLKGMATAKPDAGDEGEPTLPDYLFSPIPTRRSLFKRVAHLNQDFGSREHQPHSLQAASQSKENGDRKRQTLAQKQQKDSSTLFTSPESPIAETDINNDEEELPQDLHWEAIERILFIYAKLNPGIGYVQGMNEILGPLYYLLANDPDETSRAHAEAESFWLFHLLMAHFRDHFVRSLDRDRMSGIGSTIARMNLRLQQFDEDLWRNLEDKGIAPEYYSFRWLTVLCTQEFEVPDVWRIWDSILADTGGIEKDYDFLLDFGCAMVCHLRVDLLAGDFADNVKLLQNYPSIDIQPILHLAIDVRNRRVTESKPSVGIRKNSQDGTSYRPNNDLRIWGTRNSANEYNDVASNSDYSAAYLDKRFLMADGVQNRDRLDINLEGTYHGSPISTTTTKEQSPSISGLSLDRLWSRGNSSKAESTASLNEECSSEASAQTGGSKIDSRPQTATWSETFNYFKARFVGLGISVGDESSPPTPTCKPPVAPRASIDVLSPSVEL
ncbi:hypothetical protein BG011_002529 [Mortierella polycephala]|uniref:Rab-GAP TBC domain-containing protein n=1 Tax=Mortierella polycephala TaxID=41804 RepID=A0A9P6Q540_9FUNG|nr:hypothetical protein BG011_002529 [Mortierella polycephala]